MSTKCKHCMSKRCPTGNAGGMTTYEAPIYEYAKNEDTMCKERCKAGWVCTREKGHNGDHDAQTGRLKPQTIAIWERMNENLKRIE